MDLIKWNCQLNAQELTVGELMGLSCQGEAKDDLALDQLKVETPGQSPHTLQLVKAEAQTPGHFQLTLTSYRVGEHKDVSVLLKDESHSIDAGTFSWTVKTVLQPKEGEAPKPFGPFGPWYLSWPILYFVILIVLASVLGWLSYRFFRTLKLRRDNRIKIENYRKTFVPYTEFQKGVRQIERKIRQLEYQKANEVIEEGTHVSEPEEIKQNLKLLFDEYLLYELEVSAQNKTGVAIAKLIKKQYSSLPEAHLQNLRQLYEEWSRSLSYHDLHQLIDHLHNLVDQLNREELEKFKT